MTRWMLAAVVALAVVAAGCGTDETGSQSKGEQAPVVKKGPVKGSLTISQWPLYIDPGKKGTIAEFGRRQASTSSTSRRSTTTTSSSGRSGRSSSKATAAGAA